MDVTYIEFLYPGTFFAESSVREVPSRALPAVIPGRATGYRFYSRSEVEFDGETLRGKPKDYSPWTYFGKEYSLNQLALEHGVNSILYGNIANNGYTRAVKTIYGNWYQLNDGDCVVADADVEREE